MSRTTIDIVQTPFAGNKQYSVRLLEPLLPQGSQAFPCSLPVPDWTQPKSVSLQGQKLYDELKGHPGIGEMLANINRPPHVGRHTLGFQLSDPEDEKFYWESLHQNGGFLALGNAPPVSIVRNPGATSLTDSTAPVFSGELRILALLSAFNRPARDQWLGIRAAAEHARANNLELRISFRVGERQLLTEIQDAGLDFIEDVAFVPKINEDFVDLLREKDPHLIHFYCHGMARRTGNHELRLATFQDWESNAETSPLILTTNDFRRAGNPWLVVLNSCDGGDSREGFSSFAYSLVSSCNIPHVVAMLEEFDANDAHQLCGRLYPQVLGHVLEFNNATLPNNFSKIDFSDILDSARRALSQQSANPEGEKNWVIPALYMRRESFKVLKKVHDTPADGRVSDVIAFLKNNPNLPQEVKQAIVNDIFPELNDDARTQILTQFAENGN